MAELGLLLLRQVMHAFFWAYIAVVLFHFAVQLVAAETYRRRYAKLRAAQQPLTVWPSVAVIVPVYNEEPDTLDACLASIAGQRYPGRLVVHVVDDGSPNRGDVMNVYDSYATLPGWRVHLPDRNGGKRHAQDVAMRHLDTDIVLTIDSDTQVEPDGAAILVRAFDDETVGAATGSVRVANAKDNLLTRMVDIRYWVAFNQERASHSASRAVLCCSGPFSMYRMSVLADVWNRYVTQTFRRIPCTYGDDRHLTNLVLAAGMAAVYVPDAHCVTTSPRGIGDYLRQQLRWNKSYYRELLWTLTFLPRLGRYMIFEVAVQVLLPLMLTLAVTSTIVRAAVYGPHVLLRYSAVIGLMAVLHSLYGMWRTRDASFLLFVLYGFLHAALLIPVRVRAIGSLGDAKWGTRLTTAPHPQPHTSR